MSGFGNRSPFESPEIARALEHGYRYRKDNDTPPPGPFSNPFQTTPKAPNRTTDKTRTNVRDEQ